MCLAAVVAIAMAAAKLLLLRVGYPDIVHEILNLTARRFG